MKDCQIYGSMILSILSSSKDKQSALQAVKQNFIFQGTLYLETEALFKKDITKETHLQFIKLIEQFKNNEYPYIANIKLKSSKIRKAWLSSSPLIRKP